MKDLTKAEEEIMHILWKIEKGFVKDIIGEMSEPKPAYNTVSTVVRLLEKKGYVDHEAFGKTHRYFPKVKKTEYTKFFMKGFMKNYFSSSFKNMVSFFTNENKLSLSELEELKAMIESEIEEKKNGS